MPLPTQIKLGPVTYAVHNAEPLSESDEGCVAGEISYLTGNIYIKDSLSTDYKRTTLWHEIIHGLLHQSGQLEASQDEDLVTALGFGITQLLRDNPELYVFTVEDM